jgi:hypothetical protein
MHHIDHEVDVQVEFQLLAVIVRVLQALGYQLIPYREIISLLTTVKELRKFVKQEIRVLPARGIGGTT